MGSPLDPNLANTCLYDYENVFSSRDHIKKYTYFMNAKHPYLRFNFLNKKIRNAFHFWT